VSLGLLFFQVTLQKFGQDVLRSPFLCPKIPLDVARFRVEFPSSEILHLYLSRRLADSSCLCTFRLFCFHSASSSPFHSQARVTAVTPQDIPEPSSEGFCIFPVRFPPPPFLPRFPPLPSCTLLPSVPLIPPFSRWSLYSVFKSFPNYPLNQRNLLGLVGVPGGWGGVFWFFFGVGGVGGGWGDVPHNLRSMPAVGRKLFLS